MTPDEARKHLYEKHKDDRTKCADMLVAWDLADNHNHGLAMYWSYRAEETECIIEECVEDLAFLLRLLREGAEYEIGVKDELKRIREFIKTHTEKARGQTTDG